MPSARKSASHRFQETCRHLRACPSSMCALKLFPNYLGQLAVQITQARYSVYAKFHYTLSIYRRYVIWRLCISNPFEYGISVTGASFSNRMRETAHLINPDRSCATVGHSVGGAPCRSTEREPARMTDARHCGLCHDDFESLEVLSWKKFCSPRHGHNCRNHFQRRSRP